MIKIPILVVMCMGLLQGCGEAGDCRMSTSVLAGTWTEEEASALVEVIVQLNCAGYSDPGYYVTFINSPEHPFKGTTWAEFLVGGIEAQTPSEGYGGYCDWDNCAVYVRRYGRSEPHLEGLLRHELLHAVGFKHGSEMREAERKVRECRY